MILLSTWTLTLMSRSRRHWVERKAERWAEVTEIGIWSVSGYFAGHAALTCSAWYRRQFASCASSHVPRLPTNVSTPLSLRCKLFQPWHCARRQITTLRENVWLIISTDCLHWQLYLKKWWWPVASPGFGVRGHDDRGAEGASIQAPKAPIGVGYGEGCPIPSRLEGLGSAVSPGHYRIFSILGHRTLLVARKIRLSCPKYRKNGIFIWKYASLFFVVHVA